MARLLSRRTFLRLFVIWMGHGDKSVYRFRPKTDLPYQAAPILGRAGQETETCSPAPSNKVSDKGSQRTQDRTPPTKPRVYPVIKSLGFALSPPLLLAIVLVGLRGGKPEGMPLPEPKLAAGMPALTEPVGDNDSPPGFAAAPA